MTDKNREEVTTIHISEESRDVVRKMKEHDLLSLGTGEGDSNTKDIYLLAVALGLDSPPEKLNKPYPWTRASYFGTEDKALIMSVLFGTLNDAADDVAAHCDTKEAFGYCRQLTDAGFRRLDEFAADAMYDPDLMARKMLDYVDSKYDEVIKE